MHKEKVIILLCDTLRAKSLPHYGNAENTLPKLAADIDRDFTVYSKAYAPAPWTVPSHLSLFTGLYPSQVMETSSSYELHSIFKSLPEIFRDSGYKTFGCSANALISNKFGFNRGFDTFHQVWLPDSRGEEVMLSLEGNSFVSKLMTLLGRLYGDEDWGRLLRGLRENLYKKNRDILQDSTPSTNRSMRLLKQYISDNSNDRIFCFVNLMQTHNRYNPPGETRGKMVRDNAAFENYYKDKIPLDHYAKEPFGNDLIEYLRLKYEEEILYLDHVIADFIHFLKKSGCYDDCTLILTSDHGEHFGENGHVQHNFSVYEPVLRIPFYIKWHGRSENNNKSNDRLLMLQDLYTTFLVMLDHWLPAPDSSYDLTAKEKRPWVLSQLPDISHDIKHCQSRRGSFSAAELGLEEISLSAYQFDDGNKIIENGKNMSLFDLNNDPDEETVIPVSNDIKAAVENVKAAI